MSETENEAPDAGAPQQSDLDFKINLLFPGVVVRKDLVKAVKGNAIVPSFVLEYLLGQYAASDDEATIQAGIDTVRKILAEHYVHRSESELVKSTIKERGRHRIIDKVTVTLNEKADVYEAEFANLGIRGVIVESPTIKAHPKLLVGGTSDVPAGRRHRRWGRQDHRCRCCAMPVPYGHRRSHDVAGQTA
jgi:ATP-dependent Lon protease